MTGAMGTVPEPSRAVGQVVRDRVAAHCGLRVADVTDETNLFDGLGLESLDAVELVTVIEEAFDVDLNLETLAGVETVGDIVDLVALAVGPELLPLVVPTEGREERALFDRPPVERPPTPAEASEIPAPIAGVELGVVGFPFQSGRTYLGRAVEAEAAAVDAVWFRDRPSSPVQPFADATIAAATVLLATRRMRVGVLALDMDRRAPADAIRACETLADLGAGRFTVTTTRDQKTFDHFTAQLLSSEGACDLVVAGGAEAAEIAAQLGVSWLADWREVPVGRFRDLVPIVEVTPGARAGILAVTAIEEGDGSSPHAVAEKIEPYLAAGARRVVIENELAQDPGPGSRASHDAAIAILHVLRRRVRARRA